jgi:MFS family permease
VAAAAAEPAGAVAAAPGGAGFHGWRIVHTLAIAQTISWGVLYYAFTVLLLPMQRELGFSTATLTGAFSLAVAVAGVAAVPVGRWVDRHGGRVLMSLGSAVGAGSVVAWSRVETVVGLYAVFALLGVVSAAVLYEPAFAVAVRWFRRERARALLRITLVAGFASTIFLPLTAALEGALGWRQALWVLAGILLAGTVAPYALVLRRDPADLGLAPDGDPVADDPEATASTTRPSLRATARWAARDRRFWSLTVAYATHTLAVVVVAVHLVPLLVEAGHPAGFAAVVVGSLGVLSVTGRVAVTGAVRRWPTHRVAAAAFAVQAVGALVLLGAGSSRGVVVVGVLLFGLGFGVGTITRPALTAEAFGTRDFATVAALSGIAATAGKAAGPVAAGLLRGATGGYAVVLVLVAAACLVAAGAVAASGRWRGPVWTHP